VPEIWSGIFEGKTDGTPIGLGGGYARAGVRFWPGRVARADSAPA
jgi:hypothetical protein